MLSVRVDPLDRDIEVLLSDALSPTAQSSALAEEAKKQLKVGEEQNRTALGRIPPHTTTVDGSQDTNENNVKPDGVIIYEFDLASDVFVWVADQLKEHAPTGGSNDPHPGLYKQSFTLFAGAVEVPIGGEVPQDADEYVFLNTQPYARRIELGSSKQAPDGVFQAVALLARARFGNIAKIEFNYRAPEGGALLTGHAGNKSDNRVPAIVVKLR